MIEDTHSECGPPDMFSVSCHCILNVCSCVVKAGIIARHRCDLWDEAVYVIYAEKSTESSNERCYLRSLVELTSVCNIQLCNIDINATAVGHAHKSQMRTRPQSVVQFSLWLEENKHLGSINEGFMKAPLTSTGESYGSSVDTEDGVWGSERFSSCSSSGDSLKKAALRLVAHLRIYGQKGLHIRPIDRKMTKFSTHRLKYMFTVSKIVDKYAIQSNTWDDRGGE